MSFPGIADVLEDVSREIPGRPAIVTGDGVTTWKMLGERAAGLAGHMCDAGLGHQAKVGVYLRNGSEYLETVFAALKAGLVPINVNYRYGTSELRYLFENADVEAVVFDQSFAPVIEELRPQLPEATKWYCVGPTTLGDVTPYETAVRYRSRGRSGGHRRSPDDIVMVYTGGTTGMPKGVMWRQGDLVRILASKGGAVEPIVPPADESTPVDLERDPQVCLVACPLMHGTGLFNALGAMMKGDTVVLLGGATFDARELCRAIAENAVTTVVIVGDSFARPLLQVLDDAPEEDYLGSVRTIISSGATWSQDVKARLLAHNIAMTLVDSFGASEISGLGRSVSTNGKIRQTGAFELSEHARLIDEQGQLVVQGSSQSGMIVVGGPLPLGYYKDPERTARTFREVDGQRFAVTGDWAKYTADGDLVFVGRGSGCINSAGEKIFPEEVEEAIKLHPGVADAAVFGVADGQFGQKVAAVVEPDDGRRLVPSEIMDHVRLHLAGFKVPRHVWFVDSLERTPAGKLDYQRVRSMTEDLLADAYPADDGVAGA